MSHKFYRADKVINGEKQTAFDQELGQPVVLKWEVPDDYIPSEDCRVVEFKALTDMTIPSSFKGVMGAANAGINNVANKLNDLFNGTSTYERNVNYSSNFSNVVVHTGLQVDIGNDEVLLITSCINDRGVSVAGGSFIVVQSDEIAIPVFNMRPIDTHIKKGDVVANGIFVKVNNNSISKDSVNLNKD